MNPGGRIRLAGLAARRKVWHDIFMNLEELKGIAEVACRQYRVKRLDASGSTARGTATESSDIDLLVEFKESDQNLTRRFFGLLHYLEDHLGCEIDLFTADSLRNPYFRERIMQERMPVYEG